MADLGVFSQVKALQRLSLLGVKGKTSRVNKAAMARLVAAGVAVEWR